MTDVKQICNELNHFFTCINPTLSNQINKTDVPKISSSMGDSASLFLKPIV